MKKTTYDVGGRPFYDDDIQTIQDEAQTAATAVFGALGRDCIVSGCTVAMNGATATIGAGLVYIGGEVLRFLGASGVTLPASLVVGAVTVLDERPYQTGVTKTCIQEQYAVLQPSIASGVPIYSGGGLTLQHVLRGAMWEVGDIKWSSLAMADYDASGKGLPGSIAWGWGLANGQGGRADLRGKFVATLDVDSVDYAAVGAVGGAASVALTVAQMPSHTHDANFKISDSGASFPFTAAHNSSSAANGSQITTKAAGGSEAHENRPPFYTLAAKVWIGF